MSSIFENIIYTFDYIDRPILFVTRIGRELYLNLLIKEEGRIEEWLQTSINWEDFDLLKDSQKSFYSVFIEHITNLKIIIISDEDEIEVCPLEQKYKIVSVDAILPSPEIFSENLATIDNPDIQNEVLR
ncbi:TPA: hypothetical protein ACPYPK_001027 [Legionella pneumophila]|nr:hypothetical protein [Legionella pneumophila]